MNSLTVDSIGKYVSDFAENRGRQYLKSEAPADNDGKLLTKLVGVDYWDYVKDATKDVFVMIYTNSCSHCKKLAPTWTKLALEFGNSTETVIAKLNIEKNDVEDLELGEYPTLIAYRRNDKEGKKYIGDRSFDTLKGWVKGEVLGMSEQEMEKMLE